MMTEEQRLSFALVPGWCNTPSPRIERWIEQHGRLPTADDTPPCGRMGAQSDESKLRISRTKRERLWAGWRTKPVKYGTGRRDA